MSIIEKVLDKLDREEPLVEDKKDSKNSKKIAKTHFQVNRLSKNDTSSTDNNHDIEQGVNSTNKVQLDFDRLKKIGILTPDTTNIKLSEQYRRIKLPILANAFGSTALNIINRNLVMVTSSVQHEGKSFTSFNLAMSVAKEFNHTVLYIDADVTQRMMDTLLNINAGAGLVDFLLDKDRDLTDLLLKTNVPRLTFLQSGRPYDKVTELWSSERMKELMNELSIRYGDRLIIFDAPPLLQDSSASILSRIVGQVIIVVEAEKTPRHILEEAVTTLEKSQYVGLILNKSNQRLTTNYGYYYAG